MVLWEAVQMIELKQLEAQYNHACEEHAFLLRCEGLTLKKTGERLGVGRERVRQLETSFIRRVRRSMLRTRFYYAT